VRAAVPSLLKNGSGSGRGATFLGSFGFFVGW
jgi:hypothetical protein